MQQISDLYSGKRCIWGWIKQLKKLDLYEEEKIQRKIETKQRRPHGGWVVGVVCSGGGDLAWPVAGGGGPAGLVVAEQLMGRWSRQC
jgi:hypothetical protein